MKEARRLTECRLYRSPYDHCETFHFVIIATWWPLLFSLTFRILTWLTRWIPIDYEVRGAHNLELVGDGAVIVCNHQSELDLLGEFCWELNYCDLLEKYERKKNISRKIPYNSFSVWFQWWRKSGQAVAMVWLWPNDRWWCGLGRLGWPPGCRDVYLLIG